MPDALAPLASQIQSEFEITLEDLDMWLIEPPTPAQEALIYIAAEANASKPQKKERAYGVCWNIEMAQKGEIYSHFYGGIDIYAANYYMELYENKPDFFGDGSNTSVAIVQQPAHGKLEYSTGFEMVNGYSVPMPAVPLDSEHNTFNAKALQIQYTPEGEYVGKDYFVIEFKQGEVSVIVKNFVMVGTVINKYPIDCEIAPGEYKKFRDYWKISLSPSKMTDDLDSWLPAPSLQALLSTAVSAVQGFADLSGIAVAQTTGTYNSGQIVLDTTAAGYTWYIDPTPFDNTDDYLPTADSNIWKAKPDSA
ncbi:MAG: hypothetical protein FWF17_00875 [Betaproteobacteria bacterium]|nr:hypothetical protein [Betaproteobacteria bacterium]